MSFTRSIQRVRHTSFNFFYLHRVHKILCILATKDVWALKNRKNTIILLFASLYLQHFVFCRFYRCLNLVYERSNECKQLLGFPLLYKLPCYFYWQKLQQSYHNLAPYNHLCLALTLKLLPVMFYLMLFQISLIYNAKKLKNSSRTSRFTSTKLRASGICSLFDLPDASSAITK